MKTLSHFFVPLKPSLGAKQSNFNRICESFFYLGRSYRRIIVTSNGDKIVKDKKYSDPQISIPVKVAVIVTLSLTVAVPIILFVGKICYRRSQNIQWIARTPTHTKVSKISKTTTSSSSHPAKTISVSKLTWFSGSKLSSLPMICQVADRMGITPSLVPSREITNNSLVPLSGQLQYCGSACVSGVGIKHIDVAIDYATHKDIDLSPEKLLEEIYALSPNNVFTPDNLKTAVLRLLLLGSLSFKDARKLQEYISDNLLTSKHPTYDFATVNQVLGYFSTITPLDFSKDDLNLIHKSAPIVWASKSISGESRGMFGPKGERIIEGNATLGEDISYAFVKKKDIERVTSYFEKKGIANVKVRDIKKLDQLRLGR